MSDATTTAHAALVGLRLWLATSPAPTAATQAHLLYLIDDAIARAAADEAPLPALACAVHSPTDGDRSRRAEVLDAIDAARSAWSYHRGYDPAYKQWRRLQQRVSGLLQSVDALDEWADVMAGLQLDDAIGGAA